MKNILYYTIPFAYLFFFACSSGADNSSSNTYNESGYESIDNYAENDVEVVDTDEIERKLIKTGRIRFETDDMTKTRQQILSIANQYKAYISSDDGYKTESSESNTIVVRIPQPDFDNFLNAVLKGVDNVDEKSIHVNDVTEEYLDVEARLKTKKELEERYLQLLKKAVSIEDMLSIEQKLNEIRSDIESIEGRLKFLKNQVSLSTLSITYYKSYNNTVGFAKEFKNGFVDGWNNLLWFLIGLTHIWPFILLAILFILLLLYVKKKLKKNNHQN